MSQSSMFGLSCMTNYTHMYEFLWSTAAIAASDKTEPKSGEHQMPATTLSSKRQSVHTHIHVVHIVCARVVHTHSFHTILHKQKPHVETEAHTQYTYSHTQIRTVFFVSVKPCT